MVGSTFAAAMRCWRNCTSRSGGIESCVSPQMRMSMDSPAPGQWMPDPWERRYVARPGGSRSARLRQGGKPVTLARTASLDPSIMAHLPQILTRTGLLLPSAANPIAPATAHSRQGARRRKHHKQWQSAKSQSAANGEAGKTWLYGRPRPGEVPPASIARTMATCNTSPIAMASSDAPATMRAAIQGRRPRSDLG